MPQWMQYKKRPETVQAIRYGTDGEGSYFPQAMDRVARFMLNLKEEEPLEPVTLLQRVRPLVSQDWKKSPREQLIELEILRRADGNDWCSLFPGDMVVKTENDEFYTCPYDDFIVIYAPFRLTRRNKHPYSQGIEPGSLGRNLDSID